MSLLDVDEKYINEEYFRSKGWVKSDENPGYIENRIYIMNGADSPIVYIRFLLEPANPEKFKLLCSIENHFGHDSCMTIPIDILYIDLDCTQQEFDLIIEGLLKKSSMHFKDNIY